MLFQSAKDVPREKLEEYITTGMKREIDRVSPAKKEKFVREQLAMHGTLEATEVRLVSSDGGKVVFDVQARPKEGVYLTWPHKLTFFFGAVPTNIEQPIGPVVFRVEDWLVGWVGAAVAILLSAIITAFFIPNMLRKGSIDLLLAKPIH